MTEPHSIHSLLLTFIMSWALVWEGKPLMWTKCCGGDEVFSDSKTFLELSVRSLLKSVEWREKPSLVLAVPPPSCESCGHTE